MALVTDIGLAVLQSREGVRLTSYLDSVGVWTIGWGHTKGVTKGQRITRAQAEEFLREDIDSHARPILAAVKVPLADHEADALVSIAFNIGVGGFKRSSFLKLLNKGDRAGCARAIMSWVKPKEITTRRQAERDQFLTPYSTALPKARSDDAARVRVTRPAPVRAVAPEPEPETTPEVAYITPAQAVSERPAGSRWLSWLRPSAPVADRPGLKPGGDPALWDVQDALKRLGYEPILRDGLNGDRTRNAVRTARRRNGLPDGEEIDAAFRAALPGLLPAMISKTRADASTQEMVQQSPDLFAPLKGILGTGGITTGIAAIGAASDAGIMDKIKGTLDQISGTAASAQEGIGVLFGIGQWLYAHWWIILAVVGVYFLAKGYVWWLNVKALWRAGRAS